MTSKKFYDCIRVEKNRFLTQYPGFEVEVIDGDGNSVPGQTTLGTVRDSYVAEEDE